jgi:hypothetical protein
MLVLKYKTHIEVFPRIHTVEEFKKDEFKLHITKNNIIHLCSRRHKCEYSIEDNKVD